MELLWDDDPEELLLELGFGCDEPDLSGRIPARFINYQSQARGINLQVFLEAQRSRIDLENPNVSNRFRQLEVLQEVSVAFSSLAGPLKGPKDMSPEARERRKKMAMLFRKASKKSLSQLRNPIPEELTVATAHGPPAVLLKQLEPEYGPDERKVTYKKVKLPDPEPLSPFVEEDETTEAEVQDVNNATAVRNPEGEPRLGTMNDRFLDRVLQGKKSLQMRESFEMEELCSFDDVSAALDSGGTHFVRNLIRGNSCQSDSSGFLEDPLIPAVPQDATPAPDLIKALSALSGGSTESHPGDMPPMTSAGTPSTVPVDQRMEDLTGASSNQTQNSTVTNYGPSLQSNEHTPQENGALSPLSDLTPPEFSTVERQGKGTHRTSSDKENLPNVLRMGEKPMYIVSSLKNQDSNKDFDEFPVSKRQESENIATSEDQSSVRKKPIVVTHFLSHQDSEVLNKQSEELDEINQDAKEEESVETNLEGSRLQSDVCLETEIDWQDVPQDVAFVSCQDSGDLNTNVKEEESVRCNPDGSRMQSDVYLETEIDVQDETQDGTFQNHQNSIKDPHQNNGVILQHNEDVESIPNGSRSQSDVYLETEIDWQDVTQKIESRSDGFLEGQKDDPVLETLNPRELIEIESLDDVFETSVDDGDVDDRDADAFFKEMLSIGQVYWAEPIHISDLSTEDLDTFEENHALEIKPDQDVLPSMDKSFWSNERSFRDSMDFHNHNIKNKSSMSVKSLEDLPSQRSISVQMLSNSSSHIVQRKDVPYVDNPKHAHFPRYFRLDTSNPFRAVQSWTNLHFQYNSNILAKNVSYSAGSNLNRPVESYWSPYQMLDHGWQSDDCVLKTFPSVSMDTGLWADGEDEDVDMTVGHSRQNGQTCHTCGRMCSCCKQDGHNMLSQRELEGYLLYLQKFRSVLGLMEEQVTEEQTAVYSALTLQDRQCLQELLTLRQAVRQEALELELQLSDLVHHHDQSFTTVMLQLLNEQSLLCSQLQLCFPESFSPLSAPQSGLVHTRTVATQCSPQQGPPQNGPLKIPSRPQVQTDSSHQGHAPAKTDRRNLAGLLHRLRDSMRH